MPQAMTELRDLMTKWFGGTCLSEPLALLRSHGYEHYDGLLLKPTRNHTVSEIEGHCIDFLLQEWDFDFDPTRAVFNNQTSGGLSYAIPMALVFTEWRIEIMTNSYEMICKSCRKRPVEVSEGEDGPWTSGYCPRCNDRLAEAHRERQEFDYFHPPLDK